jgi:hypothetical protein
MKNKVLFHRKSETRRTATLADVRKVAAFVASDHARTLTAADFNIFCGAQTMQEPQVLQIRTRRPGNARRRIPRLLPPQRSIWPPITHRQSLVPSS